MNLKTKMKIRNAVKDYMTLFPEEYEMLLVLIQDQKENLKTEMAESDVKGLQRALYTVSERLSTMIGAKLDDKEKEELKEKEHARWFATEFPQFRLTKYV